MIAAGVLPMPVNVGSFYRSEPTVCNVRQSNRCPMMTPLLAELLMLCLLLSITYSAGSVDAMIYLRCLTYRWLLL